MFMVIIGILNLISLFIIFFQLRSTKKELQSKKLMSLQLESESHPIVQKNKTKFKLKSLKLEED
jgi:hypothetical protein